MSSSVANLGKTPETVLVVVPADSDNYETVAQCLSPFWRLVKATTLREATAHLQTGELALVVLDPDLPDGDGIDWLRGLRSSGSPATRDLLVACVTYRSGVRDKVKGFHAGADHYVVYPINRELFGDQLRLLVRLGRRAVWQ